MALAQPSYASTASSIPPRGAGAARPFSTGCRPPLAGSSSSFARRPETSAGIPRRAPPYGAAEGVGGGGGPSSGGPSGLTPGRPLGERDNLGGSGRTEMDFHAFDRVYDHLMQEEEDFVGELERFLDLQKQSRMNKSRALYRSWESEVFDGIQAQIMPAVVATAPRIGQRKRAALMQEYLTVSNRKSGNVYRDIVIESEYDPLAPHADHIKFDARKRLDPCKLELRQHAVPLTNSEPRPEYRRKTGGPAQRMTPQMWDRLESTPYGRLDRVVPDPSLPPYELSNRVLTEQWQQPSREAQQQELLREIPRGKRCFPPRSSIAGRDGD